jgi:tetratricopeptide (TPR) repeat protein
MDNFTHNDEKLVRFLDGELTEEEKRSVEQELATDKLLQEQYENLLITKESIRQYGLQQKVSFLHEQMMKEMKAPVRKINPVRRIARLSVAIAAGIILLIGGLWTYNFLTLSSDKVVNSKYHAYVLPEVRDGDNTDTPAEKAYQQKNYKEVLRIHDAGEDKSAKGQFLCGVAAMELKDDGKAIACFNDVIALNNKSTQPVLNDEAEYYLSLSYIRSGDYDYSLKLLEKIKEDAGHKYNAVVSKKLIRQVRMLKWR